MSIPLISSLNLAHKSSVVSLCNTSRSHFYTCHRIPFLRLSSFPTIQSKSAFEFSGFSANYFEFSSRRKLGFSAGAENGEGESEAATDEAENARGRSTMPERFRYLTKEVPDRPVRWPWLIALAFLIYAWRAVLWELSNWKRSLFAIFNFVGYLSKLALAVIFHFIGDPITSLIRCIETILYTIKSFYSGIVAFAPIPELLVIIILTSTVLAIAEATAPDAVNSQPYVLTIAGIIGFAAVKDAIPELLFWFLLLGLFCFAKFVKKRDNISSALPVAAVFVAIGEPWVRVVSMTLYLTLAIFQYSKKLSEGGTEVEVAVTDRKLPVPLLASALAIGIHVAAKWLRYRHLTWMIV